MIRWLAGTLSGGAVVLVGDNSRVGGKAVRPLEKARTEAARD